MKRRIAVTFAITATSSSVARLAGVGRRAARARHHPVERVEDRASDHQPTAERETAGGERRGAGHAAAERPERQLIRRDPQAQAELLEGLEAPVAELDEEAAQEYASRLLLHPLGHVPALDQHAERIRAEQHDNDPNRHQQRQASPRVHNPTRLRLGRTHAYPLDSMPKYLVSGNFATNATFRYLPMTINT